MTQGSNIIGLDVLSHGLPYRYAYPIGYFSLVFLAHGSIRCQIREIQETIYVSKLARVRNEKSYGRYDPSVVEEPMKSSFFIC